MGRLRTTLIVLAGGVALAGEPDRPAVRGIPGFYKPAATSMPAPPGPVDVLVAPAVGWRTQGQPAPSPTKAGVVGLRHVLGGNAEQAARYAEWLLTHSKQIDGALFFPWSFDYAPEWPYSLKAPWVSGLTQGLALALFAYLHEATGEPDYAAHARRIAASYRVPIERGGFVRFEPAGPFIEEYPATIPTRVLNGAAVALLALYDYAVIVDDAPAKELADRMARRLASLLPQYEAIDPQWPCPLSYYSLTPARSEVLGRFAGDGDALITAMRLVGLKAGRRVVLAACAVGSDADADVMQPFYVWPNPRYMNWGPPVEVRSGAKVLRGRRVRGNDGQYDHAPFKIAVGEDALACSGYVLEIDWLPRSPNRIVVNLHDGDRYHAIGELKSPLHRPCTTALKVPADFPLRAMAAKSGQFKINFDYLDDNVDLVALLGRVSGMAAFDTYARRWRASREWVPSAWITGHYVFGLRHPGRKVLSAEAVGEGLRAAAYPCVLREAAGYRMVFAGLDAAGRWRLYQARSADGTQWQTPQRLLDGTDAILPGDCCYPHVVASPDAAGAASYRMYFSISSAPGKPPAAVQVALSEDGDRWTLGGTVVREGGIDPFVTRRPCGLWVMYYTAQQDQASHVMRCVSDDGVTWSCPTAVLSRRDLRGLQRFGTLGGVWIDGTLVLLVEAWNPKRRGISAFAVRDDGSVMALSSQPFELLGGKGTSWQGYRTSWSVVPDGSEWQVYYTYSTAPEIGSGAHIARTPLNAARLRSLLSNVTAGR